MRGPFPYQPAQAIQSNTLHLEQLQVDHLTGNWQNALIFTPYGQAS